MKTPKYIQDTAWWKVVYEKAVKAFDKQYHDTIDDAIIKFFQSPESGKE